MDRLAPFFERFSLSARMFYSGLLCGSSGDQVSEHAGHLHVLKKGMLKITRPDARQIVIETPSILFFHVRASIVFMAQRERVPSSYAPPSNSAREC
jgi:hypothetical protein